MKFLEIFIFVAIAFPIFEGAMVGVSLIKPLKVQFINVYAQYMKIIKIDVKQTGRRCKGFFSKLRAISRYETMLDVGCEEFPIPLTEGFVSNDFDSDFLT